MWTQVAEQKKPDLDVRRVNILNSPKLGGSCEKDSKPYLRELGIEIIERKQRIQFTPNFGEQVHRWAPYIQGFSAEFVQSIFDQYKREYENPAILDPFAGCGTVLVQAKLNGHRSIGTELNPLLQYIANVKVNSWDISPTLLKKVFSGLPKTYRSLAPSFLKSSKHFNPSVLKNLEYIKGAIESLRPRSKPGNKVKELLWVAFSSILIDCSNLKRTPCLGYTTKKNVSPELPWSLMELKVNSMASDLKTLQRDCKPFLKTPSEVVLTDAMEFKHQNNFDMVITSPPYMNGLDYVMNYKIEMGWLGFISNHKEAKKIKDSMVVCDNVSKGLIRKFSNRSDVYSNSWLEVIVKQISANIIRRKFYRRFDMPTLVHKYFDDLYRVMKNIVVAMNPGGRFILVIGDSLIADVYVPTDLIIAKMGKELGLQIEKIEKARDRRSGQIRNYRLRETIVTLKKLPY